MLFWCCAGAALVLVAARQGVAGCLKAGDGSRPTARRLDTPLLARRGSTGIFTPTGVNMTFFPDPRMELQDARGRSGRAGDRALTIRRIGRLVIYYPAACDWLIYVYPCARRRDISNLIQGWLVSVEGFGLSLPTVQNLG